MWNLRGVRKHRELEDIKRPLSILQQGQCLPSLDAIPLQTFVPRTHGDEH